MYGYLRDDLSTFINNLVGVVLGSIQLLLIFWYPKRGSTGASNGGSGVAKKNGGGRAEDEKDSSVAVSMGSVHSLSHVRSTASTSPIPRTPELAALGASTADALPSLHESTSVDPSDGLVSAVTTVNVSSGLVGRGVGER